MSHSDDSDDIFEGPLPGGEVDYRLVLYRVRAIEKELRGMKKQRDDDATNDRTVRLQRPIVVLGSLGLLINTAAIVLSILVHH